jgi:PAS domain S-box-containing protein
MYDSNGRIIEWNAGCEVYFGIPYQEAIRKYVWEIEYEVSAGKNVSPQSLEEIKGVFLELMNEVKENKTKLIEHEIINRKKNKKYISISTFPVITPTDTYFGAIIKDVTKLKKYEAELTQYTNDLESKIAERNARLIESESKFRQLAENINDVIITYTSDNKVLYVSPNFRMMFEREPSLLDVNPDIYIEWIHHDDSPVVKQMIQEGTEGKRTYLESQHRIVLPSGDYKWIWLRVKIISSPENASDIWLATFSDITKQKKYEQQIIDKNNELEIYENKIKNLISMMRDGLVRTNLAGSFIECNEAFSKMIGCSHENLNQFTLQNITPDKYHKQDQQILNEVIKTGSSQLYEKELKHADGTVFPVEIQLYLINDAGDPAGYWMITRDITDRKSAQKEIHESEITYREIYNATTDAIFIHDIESGKIIDVNNAMLNMYGYTYEEAVNIDVQKISDGDPPFSQKEAGEYLTKALETGEVVTFEWYDKRKNGQRFWTENIMHTAILNGVERLIVISRDITERKKAEEILKQNEQYLESILENLPVGVGVCDIEGKALFYNKKFTQDTGYHITDIPDVETWLRKSTPDPQVQDKLISDWYEQRIYAYDKHFVSSPMETAIYSKSGKRKLMEVVVKRNDDKVIALFNDITAKKMAEQELDETKNLLQESIEQSPLGIFIMDAGEFSVKMMNTSAKKIYAPLDKKTLSGDNYNTEWCFYNRDMKPYKLNELPICQAIEKNQVIKNIEAILEIKKVNQKVWVSINSAPIKNINNQIIAVLVILQDISDRKRDELELENYRQHLEKIVKERTKEINKLNKGLSKKNKDLEKALLELKNTQTKMVQSEKMISIGMLTTGIAHEINNPVNFINTGVEGLKINMNEVTKLVDTIQERKSSNPDNLTQSILKLDQEIDFSDISNSIRLLLKNIETGVLRTSEIVRSLRTFARSNDNEFDEININENIKSTLVILYHNYKNRIDIKTHLNELPLIKAYTGKINQVLMNLLANAIQSIEDKGVITIKTGQVKNQIFISIKDTGKGISPAQQSRIFEPFFTTKPIGEGTGLGLSISHNIIEEHRGRMEFTSEVNKGTEFVVYLPINS